MPDHCQKLSSMDGESEHNIPEFVGGIARKGESCWRDRYVEYCGQLGRLSILKLLALSM